MNNKEIKDKELRNKLYLQLNNFKFLFNCYYNLNYSTINLINLYFKKLYNKILYINEIFQRFYN